MEFKDRIPKLIAGHLRGELTTSEQKELTDWINEKEANKLFFAECTNEKLLAEELRQFNKKDRTPILNNTLQSIDPGAKTTNRGRLLQMKRYMAVASLVVIAATIIIYVLNRGSNKKELAETTVNTNDSYKNDVPPGTEKAILTLANGSTIELSNSGNKKITDENGTAVNQQGAQLVYDVSQSSSSSTSQSTLSYHTLSTPRGGQYQLVLPDGSHVWLNAVSSIRFPTAFVGKERNVEITGEAYFEVTPDKTKPFTVSVNGMKVEVLGTQFNINAYEDEGEIRTTLLEGSVKINKDGKTSLLKPGQQASVNKNGNIDVTDHVDLDAALAWKNGIFLFKKNDMETIMRQVSRWYDADIVFENKIPGYFVATGIPRTMPVSKLLKALEMAGGVHFEIDGKKILVKP